MSVYDVVAQLTNSGIKLRINNDSLNVKAPKGAMTPELKQLIGDNRDSLIELLKELNGKKAIPQAEIKDHYVLSSAQRRLHFLNQLDQSSVAYNMPEVVRLEGSVELDHLEATFKKLISRHEILRTSFGLENEEPVQYIADNVDFKIEHHIAGEEEVSNLTTGFIRPFDLTQAPLIRVGLITIPQDKTDQNSDQSILLVDLHHIISDGVSHEILVGEFMKLYNNQELPGIELHYKDYAEWQQLEEQQQGLKKQQNFWLKQYEQEITELNLPIDFARKKDRTYDGASMRFSIGSQHSHDLKRIADAQGATMYMVVLAIYNVLLAKVCNQDDIVVGTPTSGRQHPDLENMIGMFVNTLCLRNFPERDLTFSQFLAKVKENTLLSFDNQDYQYETLIEDMQLERDISRNPLFDVMFSYLNIEEQQFELQDLKQMPYEQEQRKVQFDLTLTAREEAGEVYFNFQYSSELFEEQTIKRFIEYFKRIVENIARESNAKIASIDILTQKEKEQLLVEFNDTANELPFQETVVTLFERSVNNTPDNKALLFSDKSLTYSEMSQKVNETASYLHNNLGVRKGNLVGLLLDRDEKMVITIFAILRLGGVYVPIDTRAPKERVDSIIAESEIEILITRRNIDEQSSSSMIRIINVDEIFDHPHENIEIPDVDIIIADLAYILYTSGSTGKPKGVAIEHGSLSNLVQHMQATYPLLESDSFLFKTTYSFDVSVAEIFGWFHSGGSLTILESGAEADPRRMLESISENGITHLNFVPSMFSIFLDTIEEKEIELLFGLKYIFLAGEELPISLVQKFHDLGTDIHLENIYGPTESTIYCAAYTPDIDTNGNVIPIGKPLSNIQLYVLSEKRDPQPIGVSGELYISGEGLARGYFNDSGQTAERFIENPFLAGQRMYRTGDLAKWQSDGNLVFLGRIDDQVKVRGFRIELGEITHQLLKYSNVQDAVTIAKVKDGDKYLVAYYVADTDQEATLLKRHLLQVLPEYMVPEHYVYLEQLPYTASGKLNRKQLPDPILDVQHHYEAPATETEYALTQIWSDVLKLDVDKISATANFFEIGGHSLKATTMVNKIAKKLHVKVPLKEVFNNRDIRSLANYIDELEKKELSSLTAQLKDHYTLSAAQRRMYFLYQFDKDSVIYNMPQIVKIAGSLDIDRLRSAFEKLITRHESLRTSFGMQSEEPVQYIHEITKFDFEEYTVETDEVDGVVDAFVRPFDLSQAPLIRVGIVQAEKQEPILMVDMHHIITDGVSHGILESELMQLYDGQELPEIELHYKDYAEWQQGEEQQNLLNEQKMFWLSEYQDEVEALDLPVDFQRPKIRNHEGGTAGFSLDASDTKRLNELAKKENATLFIVLLSAFNVLMSKLSNQYDIVIGTPTAGRQHSDVDHMIGMFVNTLCIRNYPKAELSFEDFLSDVKSRTLAAFENQAFQYEQLIDELQVNRDTSRNPLFDVMFSYQNAEDEEIDTSGLSFSSYDTSNLTSKFDLTLNVTESEQELNLNFNYASELFKESTIERFIGYFKKIIKTIIATPHVALNDIDILTEEEKDRLLIAFNDTKRDYPSEETVIDLFQKQASENAHKIALVHNEYQLSYQKLNESANQLAHYLIKKGINGGSVVGIMIDRSIEMIIGVLGILKTGGTYLPLDGEQPETRTLQMLLESEASLLLTEDRYVSQYNRHIDTLDIRNEDIKDSIKENLNNSISVDSLAYILYTSGSTGNPKGVMVGHQSLVNMIYSQKALYELDEQDNILQFSTITFDASVEQTWLALLSGLKLVTVDKETLLNHKDFGRYLFNQNITHLDVTPSFLEVIDLQEQSQLKRVVLGGESFKLNKSSQIPDIEFYNAYGPTESTVTAIACKVSPKNIKEGKYPIGRPINNVKAYVLGPSRELLPEGTIGELYLSGDGLAKNYVKDKKLSNDKFVDNPYVKGTKMYKTGDLARWLPDGQLEFIGRIDDQIKIRGFRVELGEIAHHLGTHDQIDEAFVLIKDIDHNQYLIAYYLSEQELDTHQLKNYLASILPDYMIPSHYIQLTEIPLTTSGKLNKKLLPDLELDAMNLYEPPVDNIEHLLTTIWSDVLKIDQGKISVATGFFELGGNSLKAMVVANKISEELQVTVPLREIFNLQDIRSLGSYIKNSEKTLHSSIPAARNKDYYVMSSAQKRMYFLHNFDPESVAYNMPEVVKISGEFDYERLNKAFDDLIIRHESLRTSFEMLGDDPVQYIHAKVHFQIEDFEASADEVDDLIASFTRPFDLSKAPLIRVGLVKVDNLEHLLMVDMHHIVSDGVSHGILVNEFMNLYNGQELPEIKLHYKDFAEWQQSKQQRSVINDQKNFWLNEYQEETTALDLPSDFQRSHIRNHDGDVVGFYLDINTTNRLKELANQENSTMFMVLLTIYNVLLSKLSNQHDIVVGTPTAGRQHSDVDTMIGMFVNTLCIRNYPVSTLSFHEFLADVRTRTLACFENQSYQYEQLIDDLQVNRDTSRNPLFDVMFSYQNIEEDEIEATGLTFSPYDSDNLISKFDLTLTAREVKGRIQLNFQYATELFEQTTIERFIDYFSRIADIITNDPATKLANIDILPEQETKQFLVEFNDTRREYPLNETVVSLFEKSVEKTPDHIALTFGDSSLTYSEMFQKVEETAAYLYNEAGVRKGDLVGLLLDRDEKLVLIIYAILKLGAVYVPIDTRAPRERVDSIIKEAELELLISRNPAEPQYSSTEINLIDIDELFNLSSEHLATLPDSNILSSDLAYILYTSGSTGKPKGVAIEHGSVTNLVQHMQACYPLHENDSYLLKTTYSFDVSVAELFGWQISGGSLVILDAGAEMDPLKMLDYISDNGITHINFVPSMFSIFLDAIEENGAEKLQSLKYIFLAGEELPINIVERFHALDTHISLENIYGPTEATIYCAAYSTKESEGNGVIPIGKPLANMQLYILSENNKLQPVGVSGELCISGSGLARGYFNDDLLTNEKFIENPFIPGQRMYKTGDLAKWQNDGNIVYLGRIDDQVKIRGLRIELGEITHQLLKHNEVQDAVTITRELNGDKYLVAYYVCEVTLEADALKQHLLKSLPEYMVPEHFVHLAELPLNNSGKLNRKELPDPIFDIQKSYEAPDNYVERQLVAIWSDLLKLEPDQISVTTSFFELGGHSLNAMVLTNKLATALDVTVPLKEIFVQQDIRSLSTYIMNADKTLHYSIEVAEHKEFYVLSSAQKRMYFLHRFDPDSVAYNMPEVVKISGEYDQVRLVNAFEKLILRHESLRTSFEMHGEDPVQYIHENADFKVEEHDVKSEEIDKVIADFVRPFDLSKAPLIRVGLVKVENDEHILMVDMHHIISDGVSHGILVNEFTKLYNGDELSEIKLHYKDYAEWQQGEEQQASLEEQKEFWLNEYQEDVSALDLPSDLPRPKVRNQDGDVVGFHLDENETKLLKQLAIKENATTFMVLLSVYNVLLSKLSNQHDIVVGTPTAGRQHSDVDNMIGMFVNTLCLRNHPETTLRFTDFLSEVQSKTLACFENQAYQYEQLIDELKVDRDTSRNPLFDVMFSYQNIEGEEIEATGLTFTPYDSGDVSSKFDLTLTAREVQDRIQLNFQYATELFEKSTIERFIGYFKEIIRSVNANPEVTLGNINILSIEEENTLLSTFNNTEFNYKKGETVISLFDQQVKNAPDDIAIFDDGVKITYKTLHDRANGLANELIKRGINPNDLVAIMTGQDIEMFVGVLGILKAGAAFVPIDPEYPIERINYILKDCRHKCFLSQSKLIKGSGYSGDYIDLDDRSIYSAASNTTVDRSDPHILAYIIYTSGSTGVPKGTRISHSALTNLCFWHNDFYQINNADNSTKYAGFGFDASVLEIFPYLIAGTTIHIIKEDLRLDVKKLNSYYEAHNISIGYVPTQVCEQFTKLDNKSLRILLTGGEQLNKLSNSRFKVANNYGPTENTVVSTVKMLSQNDSITIGKPIYNTKIYILDWEEKLLPLGAIGEICIAGNGLSDGYLNNDELTATKFVPNPFEPGKRMYKTGDLGKWHSDGNLEFIGRIDEQVKIRGFRIELGEITQQMLLHDLIDEACVIVRERNGEKYLASYYLSSKVFESNELRNFLASSLPEYMIPGHYIHMDKLPLTQNGKLDKKQLPDPIIEVQRHYEPPTNEIERHLSEIWSDILKLEKDQVSVTSSFFELGGHSLNAMVLTNNIASDLQVNVPLKEIFNHQDIRSLAKYIEKAEGINHSSIVQAEQKEFYALSSAQKRMYFLHKFEPDSVAYNIPEVVIISGDYKKRQLQKAFKELIVRHESLRTSFGMQGEEPIQRINQISDLIIEEYDTSSDEVDKIISTFVRPFDLDKGPLIRVGLVDVKGQDDILMVDMHHIISDGVSHGILVSEFMKLYNGNELPEIELHYKDYAEWQQAEDQQRALEEQKTFWLNEYEEDLSVLDLPLDFPRPKIRNQEGNDVGFYLDAYSTRQLQELAINENATMFMVLLSVYNVMLSKLGNQYDIVVGTPTAGRQHSDVDQMIGMFVNTLCLRNYPETELSFQHFLTDVKNKTLACFENQAYQYEQLIDELQINRDTSRNPMFDVMFSYQNMQTEEVEAAGLTFTPYDTGNQTSKFDLTLTAREVNDRIQINFQYATELFEETTIKRFVDYFKRIVQIVIVDPQVRLGDIDILSKGEREKLLFKFNQTNFEYPKNESFVTLFDQQVVNTPDDIALVCSAESITYKSLHDKANSLAHQLLTKGLKTNDIVAIMTGQSIEMFIGILGVLKAGAAFVPIDPAYPIERLNYILKDSNHRFFLSQSYLIKACGYSGDYIDLDDHSLYSNESTDVVTSVDPESLAYIIYTSGSTGVPKGNMISHRALTNLCFWHNDFHQITSSDNSTKYAGFGFDASILELFPYLIVGATIHIISDDLRLNLNELNHYFEENKITIGYLPTQVCEQFTKLENTSLRTLLTGGEQINKLSNTRYKVGNNYGPSENTVVTTISMLDRDDSVMIGKPIYNTQVYVLDKHENLLPLGSVGEICIAGDGLAEGYLNNEALTSSKFVSNPFDSSKRMYKTGDLGRWRSDGNLEFVGRIDDQVKIRGIRIELGEITHQLLQHDQVNEASVIVKERGGEKYLAAYYTSSDVFENNDLRNFLLKTLPDYMVPSHYIHLDKLPLTQNGKLNKQQLPDPIIDVERQYEAPANGIEHELTMIWSEILHLDQDQISVTTNFFELGGHSLNAMNLVNKIAESLQVVVPLKEVFKQQDIRSLARFISSADKKRHYSIEVADQKEHYLLSSAQKRMFFLHKFDPDSLAYNMPEVVRISGNYDPDRLRNAFNRLVARHESLRTSFMMQGELPVQKIHDLQDFKLEEYKANPDKVDGIIASFTRPFDLSKAPLIRVGLVQVDNQDDILMVDMHHIISDGVSHGILVSEFMKLYEDEELPELKLHYKDYAEWQQTEQQQAELNEQKEFWLNEYQEEVPALDLPVDFHRSTMRNQDGEDVSFTLDAHQLKKLNDLAINENATIFMVLLSAFNVLLSKLSNQYDIVVGTPTAGRQHTDVDNMIGMFVNTLCLRNHPKSSLSFQEFLANVKVNTLACFENQAYQYEQLIDELKVNRDTSRNPLFDVMFSYQNTEEGNIDATELTFAPYKTSNITSKFDLTLTAREINDGIVLNFQYATELFKKTTIDRFIDYFGRIVDAIVEDPETKLADIDVLSDKEIKQLLVEFNDSSRKYPLQDNVVSAFERSVQETPDRIALTFQNISLTYNEMHQKVNEIASHLYTDLGVKKGSLVGLVLDRDDKMVLTIFAIIRLGAAYVPIDTRSPNERVLTIIREAQLDILITRNLSEADGYSKNVNLIDIDELFDKAKDQSIDLPDLKINSDDLAYILYTSGSTGKPKGVAIEHGSLYNLVGHMQANYPVLENDSYLLKTTYSFDVSVSELFGWFLAGGSLNILESGAEGDPQKLLDLIEEEQVTHINFVPSMFSIFLDTVEECGIERLNSVKHIILAGEELPVTMVQRFHKLGTQINLENIYGPTEATIYCAEYRTTGTEDNGVIPIGKPLSNTQLYVLNEDNKPQPIGVNGELCIAGYGLARGYFNNKELTEERFVENPFIPGQRMYRTGDLAKWQNDGNLVFMGRIDEQVKIRGFRIELNEITHQILQYDLVQDAATITKEQNGEKYLVAYYVSDVVQDTGVLKQHLMNALPEYMVPEHYVHLNELPLTISGKLNRKELPDPIVDIQRPYVAPDNEIEHQLTGIWSDILKLGHDQISVTTSFFELGGNSLNAMVLTNRILKDLNVNVPLKEVFSQQNIRNLAFYIISSDKSLYSSIEAAEDKEYYALSSAQQRMYFLQEFAKESVAYNMPEFVDFNGVLDIAKLENAFENLIMRHESFRTSFQMHNEQPVQYIHEKVNFELEEYEAESEEVDDIKSKFIRPFDLSVAPLIRVGVIKVADTDPILMVDIHHIISDGLSHRILVKEFMQLYSGQELPAVQLHYKDFAEWQQSEQQQIALNEQKAFWLSEYVEELTALELPLDYPRSNIRNHEGASVDFMLDKKTSEMLRTLSREENSTMFMMILSCYNILLGRLCNVEDIIIGTPTAGRQHSDLENVIGMFVNTLSLRNYPKGTLSFKDFLNSVSARTLAFFENQGYQYEALIDELGIERDISRNALFDAMFVYQHDEEESPEIPELGNSSNTSTDQIAKFDITLSVRETSEGLYFNLQYASALFKKETIERFTGYLKNIIEEIVTDPHVAVSEIDMLGEKEKEQLLLDFNSTQVDFPRHETIISLFEKQVELTPNNVAVVHNQKKVTYDVLNNRSNQLARMLMNNGVKRGDVVAIMTSQCQEMVIGLLAILKCGGTFLPIDPGYPQTRINYLLENSNHRLLISEHNLIDDIGYQKQYIDLKGTSFDHLSDTNLGTEIRPDDIAYIIYTSGSTGSPKGTMVEHHSLNNLCCWHNEQFDVSESDNATKYAGFGFDASVWEIFPYLIKGACIHIIPEDIRLDIKALNDYYEDNDITISFLPTQICEQFVTLSNNSLRVLLTGGDKLNTVIETNYQIANNYGPTENTVVTTSQMSVGMMDDIPIGKPINNTKVYILGKNLELLPFGSVGEICIAGEGLARGYFNDPVLTKEKFVPNPFVPDSLMYKSGDLGKWLSDGSILFKGRIDEQVKIRGFRIELGEITHHLLLHPEIDQVIVHVNQKEDEKHLIAHYVSNMKLDSDTLKAFLKESLPDHMVPAHFVHIDEMPMTANGKVNKKLLPDPAMDATEQFVLPVNETEHKLVNLWADVLKLSPDQISVTKSFFELGGHSLRATILVRKIYEVMEIELPLRDLFLSPTVRGVARRLMQSDSERFSEIVTPLNQHIASNNNLFFIHDGTGDVHGYMKLAGLIQNYNCFGLRSNMQNQHGPVNTSIQSIAESYIARIKKIQPEGPYSIAGWSLGGVIGFDISRQLEEAGDVVENLIMIDTVFASKATIENGSATSGFNMEDEKLLLADILNIEPENFEQVSDLNQLWESSFSSFENEDVLANIKDKLPLNYHQLIPGFQVLNARDLIPQVNTIRSLEMAAQSYIPDSKIGASLTYIKADETEYDHKTIADYTHNEIEFEAADADHFSIMQEPHVHKVAETIALKNNSG